MPPDPPSAWLYRAQHVASRHANFQISKKILAPPSPKSGDAPACYGDNSHEDIFENSLPLMRFVRVSLRSSRAENSVAHCYKSIQTKICRAKIVGIQ